MSFAGQLDKAIRTLAALRRKRPSPRVARANAYAARLRAASSEGERDMVRAEYGVRRGGKPRASRGDWPGAHRLIPTGDAYADALGRDATLAGDIEALRQLGASRAVNPDTGRVLLKIWRAARRQDRTGARAAYNELTGSDKYLVPQPVVNFIHAGGKRRFDPAQLAKGTAEELEHAATIKRLRREPKLPVREAAKLIAKDHLKADPAYYDRLDAVEVPKRTKGLKKPRLKLLMKRGKVRVYLVDSHLVRQMKGQGDWANGGHSRVFPETCPPNEVWVGNETFGPERKCYILHELLEFWRMGNGMGYDQAHDLSTAAEQKYRSAKMRGVDAAIRDALKKAAS